jgi:phosphatidate cytidylyltransferase
MLSLRILTAIVLIVPAVLALFYLSPLWVAAYFGLFIAGGAWEWTALIGLRSRSARLGYTVALILTGAAVIAAGPRWATLTFVLAACGWTLILIEIIRHPQVNGGWLHRGLIPHVTGFVVLVPPLVAVHSLHALDPGRPALLLFAMVLVWVADSVAYFAGHFFGRTKLAPSISPGKTVEGVIGGVLGVAALAWLGSLFIWRYGGADLGWWLTVALVAALYSVLGDLLESKFKRAAGVKDSGQLLPGHGGVLDRIDATTAALPIFALAWQLLIATR